MNPLFSLLYCLEYLTMMNSGKPVNLLICDDHLLLGGWPHLSRGVSFHSGGKAQNWGEGGLGGVKYCANLRNNVPEK
jgi:hypothetical protein